MANVRVGFIVLIKLKFLCEITLQIYILYLIVTLDGICRCSFFNHLIWNNISVIFWYQCVMKDNIFRDYVSPLTVQMSLFTLDKLLIVYLRYELSTIYAAFYQNLHNKSKYFQTEILLHRDCSNLYHLNNASFGPSAQILLRGHWHCPYIKSGIITLIIEVALVCLLQARFP